MKKQTAVEWLVEQLFKHGYFDGNNPLTYEHLVDLQNQAKAMEKEQIINAYDKGEFNQGCNGEAKDYYNETYGSNHIADANKMVCEHQYSRSMNQPYPRRCLKCKEVEGGNNE